MIQSDIRAPVEVVLRDYLERTEWSQLEFATRCEISPSTLVKLLRGERRVGGKVALKIVSGTGAAYSTGETNVRPLTLEDLFGPPG